MKIKPLKDNNFQTYFANTIQVIDIIADILNEIGGNAHVVLTTFSTSEEFLRRLYILKKKNYIIQATLVADLRACFQTSKLNNLIKSTFDYVYLTENHSKIVLIENDYYKVSVCTSQNHTRGNRYEAGIISTDTNIYNDFKNNILSLTINSVTL